MLTEDMTLPMGIVDVWTLLMVAFVVVQIVLILVMWQIRKPNKGDSDGGRASASA
jgi:heme/copper-type cytochrome/quinol oxidase subunit 2